MVRTWQPLLGLLFCGVISTASPSADAVVPESMPSAASEFVETQSAPVKLVETLGDPGSLEAKWKAAKEEYTKTTGEAHLKTSKFQFTTGIASALKSYDAAFSTWSTANAELDHDKLQAALHNPKDPELKRQFEIQRTQSKAESDVARAFQAFKGKAAIFRSDKGALGAGLARGASDPRAGALIKIGAKLSLIELDMWRTYQSMPKHWIHFERDQNRDQDDSRKGVVNSNWYIAVFRSQAFYRRTVNMCAPDEACPVCADCWYPMRGWDRRADRPLEPLNIMGAEYSEQQFEEVSEFFQELFPADFDSLLPLLKVEWAKKNPTFLQHWGPLSIKIEDWLMSSKLNGELWRTPLGAAVAKICQQKINFPLILTLDKEVDHALSFDDGDVNKWLLSHGAKLDITGSSLVDPSYRDVDALKDLKDGDWVTTSLSGRVPH